MRARLKKWWPRLCRLTALGKFLWQNRKAEIALVSSLAAFASEVARYFH